MINFKIDFEDIKFIIPMYIHHVENVKECLEHDQPRKQIKTVPIQIVPKSAQGKTPQGFTKCNLHFDQRKLDQRSQSEITQTQQNQEYVTLPINYFKSLMMVAIQNKQNFNQIQSSQLLQLKQQQQFEFQNKSSKSTQLQSPISPEGNNDQKKNIICEELQNSISQQITVVDLQKESKIPPLQIDPSTLEKNRILNIIIDHQNNYIINHPEAKISINEFFHQNDQYHKCFISWTKSFRIITLEDYKSTLPSLISGTIQKDQILEQFKRLFRNLLFDYFTKHSFCDVISKNYSESEDIFDKIQIVLRNLIIPNECQNLCG